MARLKLNSGGESFLEVTFTQREDGLGVMMSLRVAAGVGRSSLVFRHELGLGRGIDGVDYIQRLFSETTEPQSRDVSSPFQLSFHTTATHDDVELLATWRDKKSGTTQYRCGLDQERVSQFRYVLEASLERLIKRGPCS